MPVFKTRIRPVTNLTWSPFTAEQMAQIGDDWLAHALSRIRQGIDATDNPARSLSPNYAERKPVSKYARGIGKLPVRNWTLRGVTLSFARVKVASEDKVTLGFGDEKVNQIVSHINQIQGGKMWDDKCPSDRAAAQASMVRQLRAHIEHQLSNYGPPGVFVGNPGLHGGTQIGGEFL